MSRTHREVLGLVRSGIARSRANVARVTGMSASTASARIDALVRRGLLAEDTESSARAGRRPRRLRVREGLGTVAAVDLEHSSATLALADLTGEVLSTHEAAVSLAAGPEASLTGVKELLDEALRDGRPALQAVCIGVPGPVGPGRDRVVSPARMPGWNGVDVTALARDLVGAPVVVENDANLVALGEYARRPEPPGDIVLVKVDIGIGCGIVLDGRLYRGADGLAGDVSHTTVPDAPETPCSCGRARCLDVVASGSALLAGLSAAGVDVASMEDLLGLVHDGHPLATNLLREAGERIGGVLATVVSFFNPAELVLAGTVSVAPAFVSALRASLYSSCLPATTANLAIAQSADTTAAELHGAVRVATEEAFTTGAIAAKLR